MDAAHALSDLTEVSSQIETAVVAGADGAVLASTLDDAERAGRVAQTALRLLEDAAAAAAGPSGAAPAQLHAATPQGSVFVVRDGGRVAVATTGAEATVGLVLYDLRSCLRSIDEEKPKRKPRARKPAAPKAKPKPTPRTRRKPAQEGEDGAA